MSANFFTPRGIIDAKKALKGKPFLHLDIAKTKTNKNKKFETYYIPVTAKNAAGKEIGVNVKFLNQIISSNANIPYGTDVDTAKELLIAIRKMSADDLENSDYEASKQKALLAANAEFCEALEIIAMDYLSCLEELYKYKGDKIKTAGLKKRDTYNIMQTERKANDNDDVDKVNDDGKVKLEIPIFRIKLPFDADSKKVGFNSKDKGFVYIVYDTKRLIKRKQELLKEDPNAKAPSNIVAKIKTSKGYVDLDVSNAKHFITYLSLVSGMFNVECVCVAPKSVSLKCKFRELHVYRHKPTKMQAIDEEDMNAITAFEVNEDEDLDVEVNEDEEKAKNKAKSAKNSKFSKNNRKAISDALGDDDEGVEINEPDENTGDVDDPDEDQETKDEDPKPKAKAKANAKSNTKKEVEDEDEEEEDSKDEEPEEPKAKGKKEESDAEDADSKEEDAEPNDEGSNEEDEEPEDPKPKAKAKAKGKKEESDDDKPKPKGKGKK